MTTEINSYNAALAENDLEIAKLLVNLISENLPEAESKIWHSHPFWFLDGNPIVGYSRQKKGMRLMFWSGKSFDEERLNIPGEKFKDASVFYNSTKEILTTDLVRWLENPVPFSGTTKIS
ncbi:DUF1801 domain-containing protein [Chryseobacterium sp.]|uniref:DUF1801 domain-containing protein n=1 Tax=Chryseobacterium sp. TaxID=1871047 RepID=UPI002939366A|nr:DUF1801 domain-containing protein [Chryseobacterium sp.]